MVHRPVTYHQRPRDDAWRAVTLAQVESMGHRIWLRCNGCGRSVMVAPADLSRTSGRPMSTPLLLIAEALVCSACGARRAHCWPEPYGIPGT